MNTYDAIEQAYKNGYTKGAKDFAERLEEEIIDDIHFNIIEQNYLGVMINNLLKEMELETK